MRVTDGVEMFEIQADLPTGPSVIYPTLIWDDDDTVLIDAGLPDQVPAFREAFHRAGVSCDRLNRVIITHHDLDHIGSLKDILGGLPRGAEVIAHEAEKPYIQNDLLQTKLAKAYAGLDALSEPKRARLLDQLATRRASYERAKVRVDRTVADGEELAYCGGVTVIHTPGHTPGHIALYLKREKVLVAGDALFVTDGALVSCPDTFCSAPDLARQSLRKLTGYDIQAAVCYHGGVYKGDANRRIAELAGSGV